MKNQYILLYIGLGFLFLSCSKSSDTTDDSVNPTTVATLYFPPIGSDTWETASLQTIGWNSNTEEPLYNFLEENDTKAFIILKDGKIVIERYFDDFTKDSPWYWASAGKTLTAFITGIASENGFLELDAKSSDYLGQGWTNAPQEKEELITVWHQLTMTSGLDETTWDCTMPDCLTYLADAGTRWSYHNAPYTLIQDVVANATQTSFENYFTNTLKNKIGMDGRWIPNADNNTYWSTARSMARFGLLNLNNGTWKNTVILGDTDFLTQMKNTSQDLNKSYGYLWWLNGKESAMVPSLQIVFNEELIPNAPDDLYAGLGKNDQKLYVVPSVNLVVVRMGEDTGETALGPSSFDNELWGYLNTLMN
ncbi:serine hydrolase domain-containing protein [Costertonia aggregata]|uniref:Beta-lactamase family protein n=1 Tax=Costertonia aggregata TaxID=343403 RepID=A0A7H9AL41_9FLAO|nr:serine hydrolase domain-containing protein [Costertonia aggregata]QLG44181.1 beta-lactamase family protein [Costertonia aggregata]